MTDAGGLDLVTGPWDSPVVTVFWGDGAGGFSSGDTFRAPGVAVQQEVADLDEDGYLDILVCCHRELPRAGVALFWGNGERTFTTGQILPADTEDSSGARYAVAGDFDHDGDLDVAATQSEDHTIIVYEHLTCRGTPFVRGDANTDGTIDIADALAVLNSLFGAIIPVTCRSAADANDDGTVNIADAVYLLSHLFAGTAPPVAPFPDCGRDPTDDALECEEFSACGR